MLQKIVFKNVSFTYDGKQNVLEDVSFIIPSASQVAIIGESGSGKSTIIKLLLRFYEPTHGEILIDDLPIQKYNKSFLRAQIGSAFQNPFLFSSTIQQNINYTKMDAMEDEIDAAAAVAKPLKKAGARWPRRSLLLVSGGLWKVTRVRFRRALGRRSRSLTTPAFRWWRCPHQGRCSW